MRIKSVIPLELAPFRLFDLLSISSILPESIPLMGRRALILIFSLELIQLALVRTRNRARAAALAVDNVVTLALLTLALFALHLVHFLGVAVAVERQDVQAGQVGGQIGFEYRQELGIGTVGAGVIVDDEFVVGWVFRRTFFGRPAVDVAWGMGCIVSPFIRRLAVLVL